MVIRRAVSWIMSSRNDSSPAALRRPRNARRRPTNSHVGLAVEHLEERALLSGSGYGDLEPGKDYVKGSVVVSLRDGHSADDIDGVINDSQVRSLGSHGIVQISFPTSTTVLSALDLVQSHAAVNYAEPDFVIHPLAPVIPDDERFSELWGLHNTGQPPFNGVDDADIDAPEAWEYTTGDRSVVLAIIDSGIDVQHPDLVNNLWVNPGEIAGDGLDNDGNGYVDDINGWSPVTNSNDISDGHGHGTHVAGTTGAEGNNGVGVVGVNWQTSLMTLRIFDDNGGGASSSVVIEAVTYAADNGAVVANGSYGSNFFSQAALDTYEYARDQGQLFIAAAGNDGTNNDQIPHYPSDYDLDSIIAVAALNANDALAGFSNFGSVAVDIGAPGVQILSTTPTGGSTTMGSNYDFSQGTSMAAPQVAGAAALALSINPSLTYSELREAILNTVDPISSLSGRIATGGRLNAFKLIDEVRPKVPATPTMLTPIGAIADATPLYSWTEAELADTYELVVFDTINDTEVSRISGLSSTSYTSPSALDEGEYEAIVRGVAEDGVTGEYSEPVAFQIDIPAPGAPGFTSPVGALDYSRPIFSWTAPEFARTYELVVRNRITGQRIVYVDDLTSPQYEHFLPLKDGSYRATVRAINEIGEFGLEGTTDFSISVPAPGEVEGLSPIGLVDDTLRPVFTWTAVEGADLYDLWVNDLTRGIRPALLQENLRENSFVPTEDLLEGSYRVWVRGKTASGVAGPWSDFWSFQIDIPRPEVPEFITPDSTFVDTLMVDITWTETSDAATYDLWINNRSTGQSQFIRERALEDNAFSQHFDQGNYTAWIRAQNIAGEYSAWSASVLFVVDVPTPGRPVLTGPLLDGLGATADSTPDFAWNEVEYATRYDLWLRDLTRNEDQVIRETDIAFNGFSPEDTLPDGDYVYWVRAFNAADEGGLWSLGYHFRIDSPRPTTPVLLALPPVISDSTPRFSWTVPNHAVEFQLYIQNLTLKTVDVKQVTGSFHVMEEPLENGTYQVWVRAFNSNSEPSAWSTPIKFILVADAEIQQEQPLADPASGEDLLNPDGDLLATALTLPTESEPIPEELPVAPATPAVPGQTNETGEPVATVEQARAERDLELQAIMADLPYTDWLFDLSPVIEAGEKVVPASV